MEAVAEFAAAGGPAQRRHEPEVVEDARAQVERQRADPVEQLLHEAAGLIEPLAVKVGGPAWLKCENLQRTGSFKIRGAYNRISSLGPEERAAGVVAASAGNHGQAVAWAAPNSVFSAGCQPMAVG